MRIRVIACCLNEEDMLPFFLQHYSSFVDEILIFDGGSTDRSYDIIKQWPKAKLFIRQDDVMDERLLTGVRNDFYKVGRENWDFVIIVDVDELLWHTNIISKLQIYKDEGVTIPKVTGYDMYSKTFPNFNPNKTIIDQIKTGKRNDEWQSKNCIFNPKAVDINYEFGCHRCHPTGNVVYNSFPELLLLHYNHVGFSHFIKRHKFNAARMSEFNKQHNLAFHIPLWAKMTEEEFNKKVQNEATDTVFN